MHSNDERLRLAYRAMLDARDADLHRSHRSQRPHPEPEALVAVAERSGSEAVRLEVLDHVMSCNECRHELDLVRASLTAAGTPRQRTWFRSPAIGLMALAATLLLVAGVKLFLTSGDVETGPRLRGGSAVSTYPVRWLPTGAAGFAWHPVTDASSYRLEVIDEAGTAVVDSTMRDTTFVLFDAAAGNRRGLTWTVTAILGDGSTVSSLPIRLDPAAK
jgi:hypothetical protein